MAATEGAAAKEEEERKSSSVEKQFMLGSKGGQSPDLWREEKFPSTGKHGKKKPPLLSAMQITLQHLDEKHY